MTDARFDKLVKLRESSEALADKASDIRGRRAIDIDGRSLGRVRALLIDAKDRKVLFLELHRGGILGVGGARSFIPVGSINSITRRQVQINQNAQEVASAPVYDPDLVDRSKFFEDTYGYYGFPPFLATSYTYPPDATGASRDRTKR